MILTDDRPRYRTPPEGLRTLTARRWPEGWAAGPAAAVTALLMFWHLGTPALWLDESASVAARARTWTHLGRLLGGSDAPLVPYYAVLKTADGAATAVVPALAHHPGVLARWPSALAVVVAVALLTGWVQRAASTLVAGTTAAVLLLTTGLSRYAQEARPYALVLLLAVTATVLWWTAVGGPLRRSRWAWPAYGLAVAALAALHVLAATLVAVHVLAAPLLHRVTGSRRAQVARTIGWAVAGLAIASPLTLQAVQHGGGAKHFARFDLTNLLRAAGFDIFGLDRHETALALLLLLLGVLALALWTSPRYGDLVRLSALWTLVPPLVWALASWAQPKLLVGRYILFALPGLAVLASLGLVFVVTLLTSRLRRAELAAAVAVTVVLVPLALLQRTALEAVRAPGGHGEDLRPILADLDAPPYRGMPVYIFPSGDALEVQALDPGDDGRLTNAAPQTDLSTVWPMRPAPLETRFRLRDAPAVIFVVHGADPLPAPAVRPGYRVTAELPPGNAWRAYVVEPDVTPAVRLRETRHRSTASTAGRHRHRRRRIKR